MPKRYNLERGLPWGKEDPLEAKEQVGFNVNPGFIDHGLSIRGVLLQESKSDA